MMKFKKMMLAAAVAVMAIGLAACKQGGAANGKVKVGILQLIDQSALDDARKGFEAELAKEVTSQGRISR